MLLPGEREPWLAIKLFLVFCISVNVVHTLLVTPKAVATQTSVKGRKDTAVAAVKYDLDVVVAKGSKKISKASADKLVAAGKATPAIRGKLAVGEHYDLVHEQDKQNLDKYKIRFNAFFLQDRRALLKEKATKLAAPGLVGIRQQAQYRALNTKAAVADLNVDLLNQRKYHDLLYLQHTSPRYYHLIRPGYYIPVSAAGAALKKNLVMLRDKKYEELNKYHFHDKKAYIHQNGQVIAVDRTKFFKRV